MHGAKRATPEDPQTPPPPGPLGLPRTSEMSPGVTVREVHPKGDQISSLTYLMSSHPKGMHSLTQGAPRHSQKVQSEAPRLQHPLSASPEQRNPKLFPYPAWVSESSLPPRSIKRYLLHSLTFTGRHLLPTHIQPYSPSARAQLSITATTPRRPQVHTRGQ